MMVIHPKFRSLLKKSKRITNRIEDQKDPKEVQLIFFKFLTILWEDPLEGLALSTNPMDRMAL